MVVLESLFSKIIIIETTVTPHPLLTIEAPKEDKPTVQHTPTTPIDDKTAAIKKTRVEKMIQLFESGHFQKSLYNDKRIHIKERQYEYPPLSGAWKLKTTSLRKSSSM